MLKRTLLAIAIAVGLAVGDVSITASPASSGGQVVAFPPLCC